MSEAEVEEPSEEVTLPPTTGLGHTVDGLYNLTYAGAAVRVYACLALVPKRGVAVGTFAKLDTSKPCK